LSVLKKRAFTYALFLNTLSSKMAKYHQIRIIMFFWQMLPSFMSCTVITLKIRLHWFPEEACYSTEKGYTDINLPPLMSNEDKNNSGSLILYLKCLWNEKIIVSSLKNTAFIFPEILFIQYLTMLFAHLVTSSLS